MLRFLIVASICVLSACGQRCLVGHWETRHVPAYCTCGVCVLKLITPPATLHPEHDEQVYVCDKLAE